MVKYNVDGQIASNNTHYSCDTSHYKSKLNVWPKWEIMYKLSEVQLFKPRREEKIDIEKYFYDSNGLLIKKTTSGFYPSSYQRYHYNKVRNQDSMYYYVGFKDSNETEVFKLSTINVNSYSDDSLLLKTIIIDKSTDSNLTNRKNTVYLYNQRGGLQETYTQEFEHL